MFEKLDKIKNRLLSICDKEDYAEFAVLVPITVTANNTNLLFEVRSEKLIKQPNEICFPGGKIESGESPMEAAVRESCEELLIHEKSIKIQCELDTLITPFNTIIYPFLGLLENYNYTYSPEEVKEVFEVPLNFFINTEPMIHYISVSMNPKIDFPYDLIHGGNKYKWARGNYPVYFYVFKNRIIWGITARIVHNLVQILKKI